MNSEILLPLRKVHGRIHETVTHIEKSIAVAARQKRNVLEKQKLHKENFTIISNTCIGGVICHDLGLQFRSPTINIYIRPTDFVKFCENLHEYLDMPLRELPYDARIGYPVAALGDILLYCKHYHSFEETSAAWEKRKKRIQWEQMYFIMTDRDFVPPVSVNPVIKACDEETIRRFDALPFTNKVCMVQSPELVRKYSSCRQVTKGCQGTCVGIITDIIGITGKRMYQYVRDFDYIDFLNEGKDGTG